MSQRMLTTATCIAVLGTVTACGTRTGDQAPAVSQDGELSGEVFIVTQGGPSIKLGLVTVTAYREKDILAFVEERKRTGEEVRAELAPKLMTAHQSLTDAETELAAARSAPKPNQSNSARASYLKCLETAATMDLCKDQSRKQFERDTIAWRDRIAGAEGTLEAHQDILAKLQELSALTETSEYYFIDMPPGFATAKTNADGLFTMAIPTNERIALAAKSERNILGVSEQNFWLVWVTPNGQQKVRVMLSNDNLTTSGSPESLLQMADTTK